MNFDFSNAEIVYIYGTFKKRLIELEQLGNVVNAGKDIELIKSILAKIETVFPDLAKLPL